MLREMGRVRRREEEVVRVENGATGVERSRESNRDWVIYEREVGGVLGDVERVREVRSMDRTRRNGELLAKKKEIPEPTYEDTFQESEILLFRAVVLEKMGKVDECVELLEKNEKKIVDDAARLTQLCRLKIAATRPRREKSPRTI